MNSKKNVFITGANGGLGRSFVEKFAQKGYNIIAHLRLENESFNDFSKDISEQYGVNVNCTYFDLNDENTVKRELKKILATKIRIDVLINNAGIEHGGLFQMTPVYDVRRVFDINFFAAIQVTQIITRSMIRNKSGAVVNIASVAGLDAEAGNVAYGTSKAALIAFTKTAAKELALYGIRVNAVAPGLTETRMASEMEQKAGKEMIAKTSFKRLAKPSEIADAVYYLVSDESSFITGQVIRVDGGM